MRRINYKSDIPPLLLSLKVDEKQITVPECDFIVRFYIEGYEGRHYDCSHIGGVWSNCEPSEDGTKLVCYINNQRLGIGELCAEFHYISPDRRYSDGSQKSVVIIDSTELGVELVEDNGDAVTEAAIDVTLPFIYRTAYEIAREHGYTGTAEDFYSALASVVAIADAEKKRVTAEITRNANEQERIENEENRLNAESERVNAEAQRVRNEAIRCDAESDRVEQEEDRKAKFVEITGFIATVRANEGNRESNELERQTNEDTRITEEAKRVEAEKKRAAEFEQQKLDLTGKIDRSGDEMGGDLIFTDNAGVSFRTSDGGAHTMFNDTDDVAKFTADNGDTFEFKQNETPNKNSSAVVVSANLYNALDMTLDSMGSALDGDAAYRAEAGDKIFNPDTCKIQRYNSTIGGFEDLCDPIDGKLYANKMTDYIYRWNTKAKKMVFVGGVKAYTKDEADRRFAKLDDATQIVKAKELEANNSVTAKSMWIGDEGLLLGGDGNGHLTVEQDEVITDVTLNNKLATKADDVAYGVEWNNGYPTGEMQETTVKDATQNTTYATLLLAQSYNILEQEVEKKANKTELDTINTSIEQKVAKTDITQSTGTSTTSVMSQKAVSDIVDELEWKVTNIADEEDITVIEENGKQKLKFADRNYEPLNDSGKGYKILRKNIQTIDGVRKNILTQNMINKPNTIYEIRYDFDLNGKEITIPENCVLKFNGGSLSNGTIKGNNTLLKCDIANLVNIKLEGIFSNDIYKLSWFTDNSSDDINTLALQNMVDNQTISYICIDISLNLTRPIEINHSSLTLTGLIRGSKSTISVSNIFTPVSIGSENISSFFYLKQHLNYININNIILNGKFKVDFAFSANNAASGTTNYAKLSLSKFNCLECRYFLRAAIRVHSCEQLMIENSRFQDNNCAIYISRTDFDYTNILNIEGRSKFTDNIVYVKGCYIQRNNYGIITSFGTDFTVQQCTFGQSSTYDIFACNGVSFNYINSYSEGAGNTRNWIDENGVTIHRDPENINIMVPQLANNHTDFSGEMVGWGLIKNNLYNRGENNKCIRPTAFIKAEVVSISDVFISLYDSRNTIANNEVDLSINDKIGIDTIFHIEDSEYRNSTTIRGISIYDQRKTNLLPRYLVSSYGNVNCNFINIPIQYSNIDFYTNLRQTFNVGSSSVNVISNLPAKKHPSVDVIVNDSIYNAADVITRSSYINGVQFYKYNEGENISILHGFRFNKEEFQRSFIVNLYVKKEEGYDGGFIRVYAGNNISDKHALSYLNLNNFVFDSIKLLNVLVSYSDIKSSDKYIYLEVQPSTKGNAQTFSFNIPSIDYIYNPTIYRSEIDEQGFLNIGKTEHRPSDRGIGNQFYDTTLKKYIVWNGTEWTNMDGTNLI